MSHVPDHDPTVRPPARSLHGSAMKSLLLLLACACIAGFAVMLWLWGQDEPTPPLATSKASTAATGTPRDVGPDSRASSAVDAVPAAPRSGLDARLIATVVRPDPAASFASISRRDGSKNELLSVGDVLSVDTRARVVAVGDGFADIDHAGTMIRLTAQSRLDPLAEQFLEAVRNAPPREVSEAERARRAELAARLRARMDAGPGSGNNVTGTGAFADARTSGHWDGDRLESIEIDDIEPGGIYDELGFENGDRISTINGIAIGDPDAAGRILKEFVGADEIVAGVDRSDGPGEVTIPSDALLDELRARFADLDPADRDALEGLQDQLPDDVSPDIASP